MASLFLFSVLAILYVYVGYPILLALWARLRPRPVEHCTPSDEAGRLPSISIVLAARNEGRRLRARLHNLVQIAYPPDRVQIVVASDGSTDDTLEVLAGFGDRVEVIALPPGGKAAALNAAVAAARNEILVFADARQRFAPSAVRALVSNFADPEIGGVSGELLLDCERGAALRPDANVQRSAPASSIGDEVGLYWRYEKWLRRRESAVGSTLGATGAIFALRRSLWHPLPPDTLIDDVLTPMRAVLDGYRVIFDERAQAFDEAARDARSEQARKTRTLAGNYQILWLEPRLLVPLVNPVWFQYVSHKLGRLLVPWALLLMLASSARLALSSKAFALVFVAQVWFYLLAGYGAHLERRARWQQPAPANLPDAASSGAAVVDRLA